MNMLKPEKKVAVISALVEGSSIRATERMTGVHRDTIMRLLVKVGKACYQFQDGVMKNLPCKTIEVDEIWTFVFKKQGRIRPSDARLNGDIGDQYVFLGLDPKTKLVPCFTVGKRDGDTATIFMQDLERRLSNRIQLTTDAFGAYVEAVEEAFAHEIDYAQMVKIFGSNGDPGAARYEPPSVQGVSITFIQGQPNRENICTSYVERHNLTMRMQMRRFSRLTLAFSKKLENLKAALALYFVYYNFCHIHRTLRMTPAMAAGVANHIWGIEEVVKLSN